MQHEPYLPPEPSVPTVRRHRTRPVLLGLAAVVAAIALVAVGWIAGMASTGDSSAAGQAVAPPTASPPDDSETSPAAYTPTTADFRLEAKVLRRSCFGSAGCNVSYRVDVSYSGAPLDPGSSYEVTYKVYGPEDGPQINTLTLEGTQFTSEEETVQTRSSKVDLRVVVTDVTEA
jgi:hypothetical protein